MDKYEDFDELKQNETEGIDYDIVFHKTGSEIAVMAIHGGGIEPGTIEIADAIAGSEHTFYAFKGLKQINNKILHINSNRYDEPLALKASSNSFIVISVHGCKDKNEKVFIGGKNQHLKNKIMNALKTAGYNAVICDIPGLRGISTDNICNKCKSGQGVQLEISRGLREKMFENLDKRTLRKKTDLFYKFVSAIKDVIILYS